MKDMIKIAKSKWGVWALALALFSSCSSEVDFGEQYQKTLYIVDGKDMLHVAEHNYTTDDSYKGNISIYCAGSKPTDKDVTVSLDLDYAAVDSFNYMGRLSDLNWVNKAYLPAENFSMPNKKVTIHKGAQYSTMDFSFNMNGLDPDSMYVIPISIVSNDQNYAVNPQLETLIYEIRMINGYVGSFSGKSEVGGKSGAITPTLKALSHNQHWMPIHNLATSTAEDKKTNMMVLTMSADSTAVSISAWKDAKVKDLGNSTYDTKRQIFTLNYSYTDKNNNEISVITTIRNIANKYEEEDAEVVVE